MLTVGIISSNAANPTVLLSGGFDTAKWTPNTDIEEGKLKLASSAGTKTITSVDTYDLGTVWDAAITIAYASGGNKAGQPTTLKVGELSAVLYNYKSTGSVNAYVELKNGDGSVATYDLGATYGGSSFSTEMLNGDLGLSYDNGTAIVSYKGNEVISETVSGLTFDDVNVVVSAKGMLKSGCYISGISLSTTPATVSSGSSSESSSESSSVAGATKVMTPITGALDAAMWTGATVETGGYVGMGSGATKTITTADTYDLTDDWTMSFIYTMNNYWNNMTTGNEIETIKVGDIEVLAHNPVISSGSIGTQGYVELKIGGTQVKSKEVPYEGDSRLNKAQIVLTVSYDNGIFTVAYSIAAQDISDSFTYDATASALDFSDVTIGASFMGVWMNDLKGISSFSLETADCASSSSEASSGSESSEAPVSSAPESSEAPVSSAPESSEAPVSSDPSSETSSSAPVAEKIITPISGTLVAEMWDPAESIVSGAFSTGAHANVITVTSVKKYDLGTDWTASMKLATGSYMGNDEGQPSRLIVGEVEGIIYNSNKNTGADPYIALKVKGAEVGTYQLPASASTLNNGHSGVLTLTYKDGAIKLLYKDEEVISYDASGDSLDFSAINFGLSLKGNWVANEDKFSITEFAVVTADCIPELGEPIVDVTDAAFNAEDWTGDTAVIDTTAGYFSPGNATSANRTISSAKKYNLSEGFKFSSKLYFKNSYANYYGESAVMYVGDVGEGIELHIKNTAGQGLYTGSLVVNGEEVATVDLLNTPNGTYEMVYKNGKLTVNLEGAAISWNVPDGTSTSITIEDVDLSSARLNFSIAGNWATADRRHWSNWSLTSVTGGGVGGGGGTTGDARNLIVPAVAIVLGACAVAFVATRKKTEA